MSHTHTAHTSIPQHIYNAHIYPSIHTQHTHNTLTHNTQDIRIDFAFDNAYFDLAVVPFRIPYPVPFKLLGDETKVGVWVGEWMDV